MLGDTYNAQKNASIIYLGIVHVQESLQAARAMQTSSKGVLYQCLIQSVMMMVWINY